MDTLASTSLPDFSPPVVVTFARPEESGPFRRHLFNLKRTRLGSLPAFEGCSKGVGVLVIHTGIGPVAAGRTIRLLMEARRPARLICAGFGGGLDPRLAAGDTLVTDFSSGLIVSCPDPVETPAGKAAMHRKTGAGIVDMETSAVAAICAEAGIPLLAIRAVSDPADEPLPVPFSAWFDIARQRVRPLALLGFLLRRPSRILPFARFVSRLPRVAASLARAIEGALH